MKIAYIISAYKYPEQLIRLVLKLNTEDVSFLIHIDRKTDNKTYQRIFDSLNHLPNVYFLNRHDCYWGGFGHVDASIKGIKEIFKSKIACDQVILLTGQDYPIKSNSQIKEFLYENKDKSFINYFSIPSDNFLLNEKGGLDRIEYWHLRLYNKRFRLPKTIKFGFNDRDYVLSFPPVKRQFPQGFKPFGGSSYWCLSKDCAEYIHNFIEQNQNFVSFFKNVLIPDELFFQTLVLNSPFKELVVNDDLRYIKWRTRKYNPEILVKDDFAQITTSSDLFARKFDMYKDAKILDMIDQII